MQELRSANFRMGPALPGVSWGQTTRLGGVSTGVYGDFNLADHVGEAPAITTANWQRFAELTPWRREQLATVQQVHGSDILEVDRGGAHQIAADALISRQGGLAVGVYTADCLPVLLVHRAAGVVAAAHCGWRGVAARLAVKTLRQMLQPNRAEAPPSAELVGGVRVWLGAGIAACSYEVGEEVAGQFASQVLRKRAAGKWELDLGAAVAEQLVAEGLADEQLTRSSADTYTDSDLYSYRRDGPVTGRLLSWVGLSG